MNRPRLRVATLRGAGVVIVLLVACQTPRGAGTPMWPGARFSAEFRDVAVLRGLDFIYGTAASKKSFTDYASDYLWCFYTISASSVSPVLRARALGYGRALARRWLASVDGVPRDADADAVSELSMSLEASERLGVRDDPLRAAIAARVPRFSATDFLGFDPRRGAPPTTKLVLKGKEACVAAGMPATADSCPPVERTVPDYDVWYDALITTYFGDRFGVTHGATRAELMRWQDQLLPYPTRAALGEDAYYDLVYLVTHIIYTHNDYGMRQIDPAPLAKELRFIRTNFQEVVADGDAETFAEFVDTLKRFGFAPATDVDMAGAIEAILSGQNADGSWGDPEDDDVYNRYHATWTAVDALRDYRTALPPTERRVHVEPKRSDVSLR